MRLEKPKEYGLSIYEAIASLFDKENENHRYDLNNIDLTEFFKGIIIANNLFHKQITGEDTDLLDLLSLNQRLVFQYLQENGKEKDETM